MKKEIKYKNLLLIIALLFALIPPMSITYKNLAESNDEDTVITFVRTGTPEVLHPIFDPMIEEYEANNPNITIDMQDQGWSDAEKTIQTMAASKTLPDVMYHLPGTVFNLGEKGLIRDLSDFLQEDTDFTNDIYPSLLAAGQLNGKQYLIPCGATTLMMWYSSDLFEEAGLDPDTPPKTWDELFDALEALDQIDDIAPLGLYTNPSGGETSFVYESFFTTEYGDSAWDSETNTYIYDFEEGKESAINTLDFLQKLTGYAQDGYVEYSRFDVRTLLRDKKVAITFDAINMANQAPDQLEDGSLKVACIPAGKSGINSSAVNVGGWFIPENSEHPKESWEWLKYTMTPENQFVHSTYGSVPILKSEAELHTDGYMLNVIESMKNSYPEGIAPDTNALWMVNGEQLQILFMGDQTPEETQKIMAEQHQDIYNQR